MDSADFSPVEPARREPAGREFVRPETVRPETVRPETVRPETVRPETVRFEFVRPEFVRSEAGAHSADPLAALVAQPAVSTAVARARAAVDALLGHRVLRRRSAEVSAESALRGVWASCVLGGSSVSLADLRAGAIADPVIQGALRVSAELPAVAETWTRAPRQVLARLHLLAAADLVEDRETLGRPTSGAVSDRLDLLTATVTATRAPAVVVTAVVRAELLVLDPFPPASMVVANAAARLTLIERGLDPRSLVVLEVGALERRAEEDAALAAYRTGGADAVIAWVEHTAETVVLGAREAVAVCEALQRG